MPFDSEQTCPLCSKIHTCARDTNIIESLHKLASG
jgi:hypothetical protein